MKKLITIFGSFLIASVVLASCGESGAEQLTACDCAEVGLDMMKDVMSGEYTEEEIKSKYQSKIEDCDELSNSDENFEKEIEECIQSKMFE